MPWSIRNYNAFVRDAKAAHGLTQKQAVSMYRSMSERVGRPLYAKDLSRHPRISAQEARRAPGPAVPVRSRQAGKPEAPPAPRAKQAIAKPTAAQKRSEAARKGWETRRRNERAKARQDAKEKTITIRTAEQWMDWYDEDLEAEDEDWEGTPEYEPSK